MSAVADAVAAALQEARKTVGVKCPSCGKVNQVDAEDVRDRGADEAAEGEPPIKCTNCGKSLTAALKAKVQEAARGGLVKCPECGTLNVPGAAKCKNCDHGMKQVTAKAKSDGRSSVSEAVAAVLEGGGGKSRGRTRRGKFADLATLATGKRAVPKADAADAPTAKGATETAAPTSVAESVAAVLEADGPKMKLANKPGKTNWVEKAGGLPNYIKRIAEHIKGKNPDWNDGRAIAVAKNAAEKMCASGDVNFPGKQNVNAGSRAEACAAVAEWNAKRGKGKVSEALLGALGGDEYDLRSMSRAEHRELIAVVRTVAEGGLEALTS